MRRGLTSVLVLLLLLSAWPPGASAELAGSQRGVVSRGPADEAQPCAEAIAEGRRQELGATLAYEESNVGPAGPFGQPRLCLLSYPREKVYNVVLTGIDSVEQFRAAKTAAIGKLQARGIDLCTIVLWGALGTADQPSYANEDYTGLPLTCPPSIIAADEGANRDLPTVRSAVARALQTTGADFQWQPDQPMTILVYTNVDAAVEGFQRYRPVWYDEDAMAEWAKSGDYYQYRSDGPDYLYGSIVLLNLTDPNTRTVARIDRDIQQAMAFAALDRTVGRDPTVDSQSDADGNIPEWLTTGVLLRHGYRHAMNGASGGLLVEAARAARARNYPSLNLLRTGEGIDEAGEKYDWFVVMSRQYAAVAYLHDRYGDAAVLQLLKDSYNKTRAQTLALVQTLTGGDMSALDRSIDAWMLERPRALAANPQGTLKVELMLFADGQHGEALVEETAAACTFDARTGKSEATVPGQVGFSVVLGSDGSFTAVRPSTYVGNSVTLTGRLTNGQLSGTYRVVNEVTGCDGGAIPFGPV